LRQRCSKETIGRTYRRYLRTGRCIEEIRVIGPILASRAVKSGRVSRPALLDSAKKLLASAAQNCSEIPRDQSRVYKRFSISLLESFPNVVWGCTICANF